MIGKDDYGSSQKMLPILLKAKHHTYKLTAGYAIPSLSRAQGSTSIANHMQLVVLLLL